MSIDTSALLEALNSVISIPVIPFNGAQIDFEGHRQNIAYLMNNNYLSDNRPRVISIAGTSLIHHVREKDQVKLMDIAGQQMGDQGVLMAAIVPNPIDTAGDLVAEMSHLNRPPDVYLIMPLNGTYSPEGLYTELMRFGEEYGTKYGARFLYYYRALRDRDCIISLIKDSPHFIGVKIGTEEADVTPFVNALSADKIVIWGIGDRSTGAAELGAKGHTSGINIFVARASDEINNAQRRKDYAAARAIEAIVHPLEEIRFMNGRAYNYSAVVEAINLSGVEDVVAGTGGPFNPRVPPEIARRIEQIVADIKEYH
jgi:dihydrodipicolinate synthase/N-acetylneuraminate lyase